MENRNLVELAAEIVQAHVANNSVAVGDLPNLIQNVHGALAALGAPAPVQAEERKPAVSIRSSVKPDYIVCLECGKKQKMLKRHLQTAHRMTPEQYRQEWSLPKDYPLVASNYAETRRALAHKIGLGRKPKNANASNGKTQPKSNGNGKAQPKRRTRARKAPASNNGSTEKP